MRVMELGIRCALLLGVLAGSTWAEGLQQPASLGQGAFGYAKPRYGMEQIRPSEPATVTLASGEESFYCEPSCFDSGQVCSASEPAPGLLGHAFHGCGGITAEYLYTGEVFSNMRGGLSDVDATKYTGRFDMVLSGDLDEMGCAPGGIFFLHFQTLHGEGITDRFVGAHQRISNLDGNPGAGYDLTQLSQYWWQRSILDGLVTFRLGKIYCDSVFALASRGGDFINTSLGWTHTMPMPANPDPSAAAIAFFELTDWLEFKAGVWDGAPNGRNWGFSGTGDLFSIYEFKASWALCDGSLPGDTNMGMWYHNAQFADQAGGAAHTGNHGVYWGMSQLLSRENACADDAQGLGTFVQFGWAPEDRNVAEQYWGGGLVYTGALHGRDADTCGIGIGNMTFSTEGPRGEDETMIELFYKVRLGPHIVIQPDLQYIASPGGLYTDSFVAGIRFQTVL